jgi:hypothetical protein
LTCLAPACAAELSFKDAGPVQERGGTQDPGSIKSAAGQALELMLARVTDPVERVKLLLNLETQIETVLTETPGTGHLVERMAMRAEFAATLRAEIAKAMWPNTIQAQSVLGSTTSEPVSTETD